MDVQSKIPTKTRTERFIIGFLFGGISGFFGFLLTENAFIPSLLAGLVFGFLIGILGAFFCKRVFDCLIELLTQFPG